MNHSYLGKGYLEKTARKRQIPHKKLSHLTQQFMEQQTLLKEWINRPILLIIFSILLIHLLVKPHLFLLKLLLVLVV